MAPVDTAAMGSDVVAAEGVAAGVDVDPQAARERARAAPAATVRARLINICTPEWVRRARHLAVVGQSDESSAIG
jgi:hypothetical protein